MVEMRIKSLAVEADSKHPVMILTDVDESRFLPIWIGVFEADAILQALENVEVARPSTHDLLKSVVGSLDAKLIRVVIHSMKDTTFFATLVLERAGQQIEVDARPSDSVALAVRSGAPIFATENVLAKAVVHDGGKSDKHMDELKKFIEKVKPSDFEKYDNALRHGDDLPDLSVPEEDDDEEEKE